MIGIFWCFVEAPCSWCASCQLAYMSQARGLDWLIQTEVTLHLERLQSKRASGSKIIPATSDNNCCLSAIFTKGVQAVMKQYTVSWQIHASGISWHQTSVALASHKQMLILLALCQSETHPGSYEVAPLATAWDHVLASARRRGRLSCSGFVYMWRRFSGGGGRLYLMAAWMFARWARLDDWLLFNVKVTSKAAPGMHSIWP